MLGIRIAVLRRAAGMSQSELAEKLKISPSTVGMYEQGRRQPSLEILIALSDIFGISIDYLVKGRPVSEPEEQILNTLLMDRVDATDTRLAHRDSRPFSREELAVLFAALLMDP